MRGQACIRDGIDVYGTILTLLRNEPEQLLMKKLLLSIFIVASWTTVKSQTVLISEDFESYTAGDLIGANSSDWEVWASSDDAPVSSDFAAMGVNSLHVSGPIGGGSQDVVLLLGDRTGGVYELMFYMLIDPDSVSGGYFNMMHEYNTGGPYEWAFETYVSQDGTVEMDVNGGTQTFSANPGWNDFTIRVDLDNMMAEIFLNGVSQYTWPWNTQASGSPGQNRLMALNLYSAAPAGSPSSYYIDEVTFTEISGPASVNEIDGSSIGISPNPVSDLMTIDVTGFDARSAGYEIVDITGKSMSSVVTKHSNSSSTVVMDMRTLPTGIYFLRVSDGSDEIVQKVVKY